MSGWATTQVDRTYVDSRNECGLGAGTTIKATLVFDCRRGDEITDPVVDLMEVCFARINEECGVSIYSRLGCNAVTLEPSQWNTLYEFVKREALNEWEVVSAEALAAEPVEFFSDDEGHEDVY